MIRATTIARAAALAAAVGLLSTGTADADTFVPLPGGTITETLADGTSVTLSMTAESAVINPSMGSTPLHRNVWVSGTARADLSGAEAAGARSKLRPGYVVGCQVNIAGGNVNSGAGLTQPYSSDTQGSVSGGASLSLGPGQAASVFILDVEGPDAFGDSTHKPFNMFQGPQGSVTWKNATIGLSGCAGYAQARSFVRIEVETARVKEDVTLWGQPFSIG
ncbi:MspA family porin [Nocardia carnea]|uniref:MspA family porin n=1 Tax=Nocardia carnea TaxID=37328 RepID=UPI002458BD4C|nr:MspA family porin [Nocardia carnea]